MIAADRPVAVLVPNTHVGIETPFGVPWAGVPLVAVNTRLSAGEVAYILGHCRASVLIHEAYVTLRDGGGATEEEIVEHVRARLARFTAPKSVTLRDEAWVESGRKIG